MAMSTTFHLIGVMCGNVHEPGVPAPLMSSYHWASQWPPLLVGCETYTTALHSCEVYTTCLHIYSTFCFVCIQVPHILVLITIVQFTLFPRSINWKGRLLMTIADPYKVVDKHILTIFATNVPHFKIFATKVSYYFFRQWKNHPKYIVFKCLIQKHFFWCASISWIEVVSKSVSQWLTVFQY